MFQQFTCFPLGYNTQIHDPWLDCTKKFKEEYPG